MSKEQEIEMHLENFLKSKRVTDVLSTISECKITGWETWLQVEFAFYLQQQNAVLKKRNQPEITWYREFEIKVSNNDEESRCIPDFWYWSGEALSYYFIEFKQSKSKSDLRKKMQEDVKKLEKFSNKVFWKNEDYTCKGNYFVGIYIKEPANDSNTPISEYTIEETNLNLKESGCKSLIYKQIFKQP